MRIVSWIVVLGAILWLLYTQLGPRLAEQSLPEIPAEAVVGTLSPGAQDAGAPTAQLPYARVYPMLEATRVVEDLDRLEAVIILNSRRPEVAPEDILLSLDDDEQTHHFPVRQYGEVDLPLEPEWRDAGYTLRTNQPPGTLDLQVTFILRALPGPQVEYAWLWESVEQMDLALEALQKVNPGPVRDVVGLLFEYPPGVVGVVRAGEGEGAAVLQTGADGVIRLELTPELREANPTLVFEPLPERMLPLMESVEP